MKKTEGVVGKKGMWGGSCPVCGRADGIEWNADTDVSVCAHCNWTSEEGTTVYTTSQLTKPMTSGALTYENACVSRDEWNSYKKWVQWLLAKPDWWQFRKRRAWKKAEPKIEYVPILSVTVKGGADRE